MPRHVDATGRSIRAPRDPAGRKLNAPPEGEPWIWLTVAMLTSPAWAVMSAPARKVLDRLVLEHLAHGGTENGELIVPYRGKSSFESYGIRTQSIGFALAELEALGWITVTVRGQVYGVARVPSRYRLNWLPDKNGRPAPNRWKRFASVDGAFSAVEIAKANWGSRKRSDGNALKKAA